MLIINTEGPANSLKKRYFTIQQVMSKYDEILSIKILYHKNVILTRTMDTLFYRGRSLAFKKNIYSYEMKVCVLGFIYSFLSRYQGVWKLKPLLSSIIPGIANVFDAYFKFIFSFIYLMIFMTGRGP